MRYAQIKSGQKLHLVFEFADGSVSQPICGQKTDRYRMTINVPLANACKNCLRVTDHKLAQLQIELARNVNCAALVY